MLRHALIALVKLYQVTLSPFVGQHCRFYPTCSDYACHALSQYGSVKGVALVVRRLSRCHPLNPGGFDPVPTQEHAKSDHN